MLALLKILPLGLHQRVGLQLGVGFHFGDAVALKHLDDVIHHDGVHALAFIFIFDADQIQVRSVILFHRLQQVDEPKWKELPAGFLQRTRERGHGDAKAYQFILVIDHERCIIRHDHAEILFDRQCNLFFGQWDYTIKVLIGFVKNRKHLRSIFENVFFLFDLQDVQVAALLGGFGHF